MAIYSVGRRRVILALLLTSALLLTLDLRGNAGIDRVRDLFSRVMDPVEDAADVVTTPIERAWSSYTGYDDLERENEALRDQLDRLIGGQAAAEASVIDYQLLLALNNLPTLAGIESEAAEVIGAASNNIDQIVEINKGSNAGIAVGMPVVNQAGLIGKVTAVFPNSAQVMLVTDTRYSVGVEIVAGVDDDLPLETPVTTTPSGLTADEIDQLIDDATATTTTVAPDGEEPAPLEVLESGSSLPQADTNDPAAAPGTTVDPADPAAVPSTVPGDGVPSTVDVAAADPAAAPVDDLVPSTTTTVPVRIEKEFGSLVGRGQGLLPQIRFLQDNPTLAVLEVGDLVETAGGRDSLAPPGIPIGRVVNRVDRPGVGGPVLEVDLFADLEQLSFVRVVKYRPLAEVEQ